MHRPVDRLAGIVHEHGDDPQGAVPPLPTAAARHAGQRWRLEACCTLFASLHRVLYACWQRLESVGEEEEEEEGAEAAQPTGDSQPTAEDSEDDGDDEPLELAAYLLERVQNAWGAACCTALRALMHFGSPGRCGGWLLGSGCVCCPAPASQAVVALQVCCTACVRCWATYRKRRAVPGPANACCWGNSWLACSSAAAAAQAPASSHLLLPKSVSHCSAAPCRLPTQPLTEGRPPLGLAPAPHHLRPGLHAHGACCLHCAACNVLPATCCLRCKL